MVERLGDCEKCPLNDRPVVPGYGPHGGIAIVGEAPGASEVRRGRPFVGDAGTLLREVLRNAGQDPSEVYWTNAVVRHPVANKTPGMLPIRFCNERLMTELADVQPSKILSLGGVALTAMSGAQRVLPITKMRGQAQWITIGERDTLLVPSIHPALVLRDPDMFPDLAFDIEKLLRVDAPLDSPVVNVQVVESLRELKAALSSIESASVISCDLETYGFHPINDPLISIGFGVLDVDGHGWSVIVPEELVAGKQVHSLLWEFMTDTGATFPFHNAKFDLQFLRHYFGRPFPIEMRIADTMLLHYLHDERPIGRYLGHSLKDIARTWYDVPDYHWDFDAFYALPKEERPYAAFYDYQGKDCAYTARLYFDLLERHAQEIAEDPDAWFDPVGIHDRILIPGARALAEAEYHGTFIDQRYFINMGSTLETRIALGLKSIEAVAGEGFNPSSPAQVSKFITSMGATGRQEVKRSKGGMTGADRLRQKEKDAGTRQGSVDRESLEALIRLWGPEDDRSKVLQAIITYRLDSKVLQTNMTGLLERTDSDSRIRPDFQLAGTATGRLSCRNPNFQNIPAYGEWNVREGFTTPPGFTFVEVDYSQLELRVAAWLSQDPDLIEVFATGKDIHAEVAVAMFGKPAEDITSQERYMAKRVDFGIMYGRSAKALSEGPEMDYFVDQLGGERWTVEAAELYVKRFLEGFPRLRDWMQETASDAIRSQYVDTPLGRRRRFPYITRSLVGHTRRQAVNTPIQAVASDMCLQALIRVAARQREFDGHVLFTVHDSVALEVPTEQVAKAAQIIRHEFEDNIEIDPTGIPFPCDVEVGPNWGTLKKVPR